MNASRRRGLNGSLGLLLSSISILLLASGCASSETSPKGSTVVNPSASSTASATATSADASNDSIESKTRSFIDLLSSGKYDAAEASFDKTMKEGLPASKLEETWKAVESKVGHFKSIEKIDQTKHDEYVVAIATAQFENDKIGIKVSFDAKKQIAGLFFVPAPTPAVAWAPPPYANPSLFDERDVSVVGASPKLPGTLTMPKGAGGPFPAIVLVHGSGPNDRDESILAIKPFKDLAWGLASNGIAVLRYDKRSKVHPAGMVTQKEEVLDAAHDAIELLKQTPSIDPKRIYVLGHSQGGYLAPRIAEGNPSLAGVVILAGSTQPLEDSIVEQLTYFSTLDPNNDKLKEQLAKAKQFKDVVESKSLKADDSVALPFGGKVTGAYFLDVRGYESHTEAAKLSCRLLVLQGERDYQVTMREFARFKQTLGTKKNATLMSYPSLNHLFTAGSGTPGPSEYETPSHVDSKVIIDIATWMTTKA